MHWGLGEANAPDLKTFFTLPAFNKHLLPFHQHGNP